MMTTNLSNGARIGDYIIQTQVGDAYEAIHVLLPRKVRLTVAPRPVSSVRMMREACILEALRHPGVPRIFEVGVLPTSHEPWVATEIVPGSSLLDLTIEKGRLDLREVLTIVQQVADVLAYAHRRGVSHGAVRPDAILRHNQADAGSRGFPLCLINWSEARLHDTQVDNGRAFAEDVFALGLVADLVLASRTSAPPKLAALIDDMLAPDPFQRPCAAEICARAKVLLDGLEILTDDDIVEESVVLVDISRSTPPPVPPQARARVRWTPALKMSPTPSNGVVVGTIKLRPDSD
jgi:serine/threonine protein kinase